MKVRAGTAVLLVVVASCSTRAARAEEPTRYVVKPGDSCAAIARRFYGTSDLVDLIHDANDMHTPQPHALEPGRVLLIPPRSASVPKGPDAKLIAVRNRVDIQDPEPRRGRVDDPLFRGNRVATEAASSAAVTFRDETQVRLGERSLIVILGNGRSAAVHPPAEATLVTGDLRAFLSKSNSARANVSTASAAVTVVEGESKVSADAKKTTRLAVYAGNSTISAASVRKEVPTGFGSKADLGRPPTTPRPLPAAPVWSTVSPALLVEGSGGIPAFVATYDLPGGSSPAAAAWHVQVARDAAFLDVIIDETVPKETHRVEAHGPGPGRYFVRASALDDDQFEGPFGRVVVFGILRVTRDAAHVSVVPLDLPCYRVGNVPLHRVTADIAAKPGEVVLLRCTADEHEPTTLIRAD